MPHLQAAGLQVKGGGEAAARRGTLYAEVALTSRGEARLKGLRIEPAP
jgi:hypothetical protein